MWRHGIALITSPSVIKIINVHIVYRIFIIHAEIIRPVKIVAAHILKVLRYAQRYEFLRYRIEFNPLKY